MFKKITLAIITMTFATLVMAKGTTYTDKQKDAFVSTYKKIITVQQSMQMKMKKDMNKAQKTQIVADFQSKAQSIIKNEENMNEKLYQEMMMALKTNKQLVADIKKRM